MKQLANRLLLARSAVIAAGITGACVPYILASELQEKTILIAAHYIVSVLMFQMIQAWPPMTDLSPDWRHIIRSKVVLVLILVTLLVAAAELLWFDELKLRVIKGFRPETPYQLCTWLPWIMVFQALFLVAFPYVVASRLTQGRKSAAPVIVVVAFSTLIALMKVKNPELNVTDAQAAFLVVEAAGKAVLWVLALRHGGIFVLGICLGLDSARMVVYL